MITLQLLTTRKLFFFFKNGDFTAFFSFLELGCQYFGVRLIIYGAHFGIFLVIVEIQAKTIFFQNLKKTNN